MFYVSRNHVLAFAVGPFRAHFRETCPQRQRAFSRDLPFLKAPNENCWLVFGIKFFGIRGLQLNQLNDQVMALV